jgi:hypothetical protein
MPRDHRSAGDVFMPRAQSTLEIDFCGWQESVMKCSFPIKNGIHPSFFGMCSIHRLNGLTFAGFRVESSDWARPIGWDHHHERTNNDLQRAIRAGLPS